MHYFKRNIGEYHKKAGKLSMLEHGAYTLLMDACYDRERFPSFDDAMDWCWARSDEEVAAVKFVLHKFFTLIDGLYVQNRISEEIEQYHNNALINKEIALKREAKKREDKARTVHGISTVEHETAPKQEPLTINQETENNILPFVPAEREQVPVKEIVSMFNKIFPEFPQVQKISDSRKKAVKQRWIQNTELQTLEEWERFFNYIKRSDFLMGRTAKPWYGMCFDWLMNKTNFIKIYEGNYHGEQK